MSILARIWSWCRACGWVVAEALLLTAHPGAAQFEPIVPGPSEAVELELVLAVDASSSVSPEEFNLQMGGFAGAFREPSVIAAIAATRSEEHTSELQSLMRISYAVFCLKKKKKNRSRNTQMTPTEG